jgi:ssDNA-binding Zn-finger/Zn-ribbon topoisomerase 1
MQKCEKCGGATLVFQSRATGYGRYRRFQCKECRHRFNITYGEPEAKRLIDDAAVMAIRQSTDSYQLLAHQHGCSRELIRQICNGSIYKDLLPEWFRSPPKAGDPTCQQCKFWSNGCSMGFPDVEIEGPRFARDCSVFEVEQPPHSAAAAAQPISNGLLGEPGLAPPAGTLLAALSGPEQNDDRQENKHRHPVGEASDRHS